MLQHAEKGIASARRLVRLYPALLRFAWERARAYRAVLVLSLMNAVFPLVMMAIWIELAREASINGFKRGDFVGYYLGAVLVRRITAVGIVADLERLIHTGELSPYLLRPVHIVHVFLTRALAGRGFIVGVVALAVGLGAWLTPGPQFDLSPVNLGLFAAACSIGLLFEFFTQFAIGGLAFWFTQVQGFSAAFQYVKAFLGGYIVPLALFPLGAGAWLPWLPFAISLALPVEILTGQATLTNSITRLTLGMAWTGLVGLLAAWIWKHGLRVYSAVGA